MARHSSRAAVPGASAECKSVQILLVNFAMHNENSARKPLRGKVPNHASSVELPVSEALEKIQRQVRIKQAVALCNRCILQSSKYYMQRGLRPNGFLNKESRTATRDAAKAWQGAWQEGEIAILPPLPPLHFNFLELAT